jgi:hypothetical protein
MMPTTTIILDKSLPTVEESNGLAITSQRKGSNDREIEVWDGRQWVPSWFSALKCGQFFLDLKLGILESSKCYVATSDVKVIGAGMGARNPDPSFVVMGLEIVQAPVIQQEPKLIGRDVLLLPEDP